MIRENRLGCGAKEGKGSKNMKDLIHSQGRSGVVLDVVIDIGVNEDEDYVHDFGSCKEAMDEEEDFVEDFHYGIH